MPKLVNCFKKSKFFSTKHSNYFEIYDEILNKYQNKKITIVEIGILNGGSLFMWKNYFKKKARIIGIDLNPKAKKWQKYGFEIFIGDQSNINFWEYFFKKVGKVDIIIDDGGHTNKQQIITVNETIPYIKKGGVLIIEDVHASYMTKFSNPSKYSLINFCKKLVDQINYKSNLINYKKINNLQKRLFSIEFFESIVVFKINNKRNIKSKIITNNGKSENFKDYRYFNDLRLLERIFIKLSSYERKYLFFKKFNKFLTRKFSFFTENIIKKIFNNN
tara:strand:+ start:1620 stop:2444 length:825 start_codon:yes stop_codon:yes gene_type:complete